MSGDLRAAVEGLRLGEDNVARHTGRGLDSIGYSRACHDVLALIPEGAVLVTEETLAAALYSSAVLFTEAHADHPSQTDWDDLTPAVQEEWVRDAAAILRHLREVT